MTSPVRKSYDKLVRDKIPELIMRAGQRPIFRRVSGDELKEYVSAKILEEAREFAQSQQREELIDLLEVTYFCLQLEGISAQGARDLMVQKRRERGGFEGAVVLQAVESL